MQILYLTTGFLFITAVLLFCIFYCYALIKLRKEDNIREQWLASLENINRYCAYEFPEVELVLNAIINSIKNNYRADANSIRENLRELRKTK